MDLRLFIHHTRRAKGGVGSGYFDHPGRPRMLGGSIGGAGGTEDKPVATVENFEKRSGITPDMLKEGFSLPGLKTGVQVMSAGQVSHFTVGYRNNRNEIAGTCDVVVRRDPNKPSNDTLELDLIEFHGATNQNKGHGAALMSNIEKMAASAKIKNIELLASLTVGRYAWAKLGFDYAIKTQMDTAKSKLFKYARDLATAVGEPLGANELVGIRSKIQRLSSAHDIATFDMPNLTRKAFELRLSYAFHNEDVPDGLTLKVGKAFMLDLSETGHGSWAGRKKVSVKKDSLGPAEFLDEENLDEVMTILDSENEGIKSDAFFFSEFLTEEE